MARRGHVVLFPFMAQGHLIPFMALADLIQRRTRCTVTVVSTSLNVQKLRSSRPSSDPSDGVRFEELPFDSSDHGLPPGTENADRLPFHQILTLLEAAETLRPAFKRFVSGLRETGEPLCVVVDFLLGWSVDVVKEVGVFSSVLVTSGAYGSGVDFSIWMHLPHANTASDRFLVPEFPEAGFISRSQLSGNLKNTDGNDSWCKFVRRQLGAVFRSDGFLINTVEALDEVGLKFYARKTGRPVWAIGTIVSESSRSGSCGTEPRILEWLNQHPPSSVLFVAFGSMNTISASQMMALAEALESSGKPFIWVVRPPIGFDINGEFQEQWLPPGFEARMNERKQGILVRGWGPQLEILRHKSTGAFLSHCGWNSILESLISGVPVIAWPLAAEQFFNSKMLVEQLGVCVEIAQGHSSDIDRDYVSSVIKMVLGDTKAGEEMKKNARRAKEIMEAAVIEKEGCEGSSIKALDDFLNTVLS
ncbi:hypothetical protein H6P81_013808 [Aristolochia fimbriata]|uniref:Glycosyltransferase n=1 Tax=Aristolochia fimbriata TaxID=158543 RepID=A0AAV7EFQ6_ARIFI|nr:hypothetical protein H6P81_013808 [Aristolochia fimbriata]